MNLTRSFLIAAAMTAAPVHPVPPVLPFNPPVAAGHHPGYASSSQQAHTASTRTSRSLDQNECYAAWTPLADTANATRLSYLSSQDDGTEKVDLGFPFRWLGGTSTINTIRISSNGQININSNDSSDNCCRADAIGNYNKPRIAIAQEDLNLRTAGDVYIKKSIDSIVISFENNVEFLDYYEDSTDMVNAQAELFSDGRVTICYGPGSISGSNKMSAGIEGGENDNIYSETQVVSPLHGAPFDENGIATTWPTTGQCYCFFPGANYYWLPYLRDTVPSTSPSVSPTPRPTPVPSPAPSNQPTSKPSPLPSNQPSLSASPTISGEGSAIVEVIGLLQLLNVSCSGLLADDELDPNLIYEVLESAISTNVLPDVQSSRQIVTSINKICGVSLHSQDQRSSELRSLLDGNVEDDTIMPVEYVLTVTTLCPEEPLCQSQTQSDIFHDVTYSLKNRLYIDKIQLSVRDGAIEKGVDILKNTIIEKKSEIKITNTFVKEATTSPSSAPTVQVLSSPITAPSKSPSFECKDQNGKLEVGSNSDEKVRGCMWVQKKNTDKRCRLHGFADLCPVTCGSCSPEPHLGSGDNTCEDTSVLFFDGNANNKSEGNKRGCAWVARKKKAKRCSRSAIMEHCPVTCNVCIHDHSIVD